MTSEEAQKAIKTKAQIYCLSCGHSWEIKRGDAFSCPFCPNAPEEIALVGSLFVLEEDGSPIFGRAVR